MHLEIPTGERPIVLETGKLARQAGGAVERAGGLSPRIDRPARAAQGEAPAPGPEAIAGELPPTRQTDGHHR